MPTRSETLQAILSEMVEEGITASVLATEEGLPLSASAADNHAEAEVLAAIAPVFQYAAERSGRSLLRVAEEMVMRSPSGALVVCRFLEANEDRLILAGLVPKGQPYRRTMNRAVKKIQTAWQ